MQMETIDPLSKEEQQYTLSIDMGEFKGLESIISEVEKVLS